jgi:hypothetical protein
MLAAWLVVAVLWVGAVGFAHYKSFRVIDAQYAGMPCHERDA